MSAFAVRVQAVRDALLTDLPGQYEALAAVVRAGLGLPGFTDWDDLAAH